MIYVKYGQEKWISNTLVEINRFMAEILKFPDNKVHRTPPATSKAGEARRVLKNKEKFIHKIVEHYGIQLLNKLVMHGFDPEDPKFMYDYIFTMETLTSCLYRNVGIDHPLQALSDKADSALVVGNSDFDVEEDQ